MTKTKRDQLWDLFWELIDTYTDFKSYDFAPLMRALEDLDG